MSNNFQKQKKFNNKPNPNLLSYKNNKISKRANSQKKYLNSSDIITQLPKPNLYNSNNLNLNLNLSHQQALTPTIRRNKLYEENYLLPEKSSKFEGKKTLVLDIDETLVHSSFFPFEKNDLVLNVNFDGIYYNIYVLVRPWAEQFIKYISKFFEIITFTASIPAYASPLLDILDKDKNIQHRLYREHCTFINGVFIKDLKRLNRNLKDVIIVDNSPLAFAFDSENGLPIISWFDDPVDNELVNIQPLLEFLSNTKDVRKYIKKFVKNNIINYEIAYKIIRENKKNKNENENKNENKENKDGISNIHIISKDESKDNNKTKDEEKNNATNATNATNNISINKSKGKFLNKKKKKDSNKIPIIINDELKNINNNLENSKKNNIINVNNPPNLKLEFSSEEKNNNKASQSELNKKNLRNNKLGKNSVKKINKKNNIFRLGLKINENNNIKLMNNNLSPQLQFINNKIDANIENDYKINDNNNNLMPMIFSSPINTSKNKNFHIQYDSIKSKNEKTTKNQLLKLKKPSQLNINNIQPLSLKETIEDKFKSVKQYKYINLIEKFQDDDNNKMKSSSLKIINKNKDDFILKNKNNTNSGEISHRTTKFKLKTNKNTNLDLKNQLRISSKPKISTIINKGFALNNALNKNKMNDIYSQALRSRSTGNFVKLKSAHVKTPKANMNPFIKNNLKLFSEEENKLIFRNNDSNNKIELLPLDGYIQKNFIK